MPIYLEGGRILLDGGKIAMSENCCCEGDPIGDCAGFPEVWTTSASLSVSASDAGLCEDPESQFCNQIAGSYILSGDGIYTGAQGVGWSVIFPPAVCTSRGVFGELTHAVNQANLTIRCAYLNLLGGYYMIVNAWLDYDVAEDPDAGGRLGGRVNYVQRYAMPLDEIPSTGALPHEPGQNPMESACSTSASYSV